MNIRLWLVGSAVAMLSWVGLASAQDTAAIQKAVMQSREVQNLKRQKCQIAIDKTSNWIRVDLDGNGTAEVVLIISTEGCGGGNNWDSEIAVVGVVNGRPRLLGLAGFGGATGMEGDGVVERIVLVGSSLRVIYKVYDDVDPRCCPSITKSAYLVLRNQKPAISEQAEEPRRPTATAPDPGKTAPALSQPSSKTMTFEACLRSIDLAAVRVGSRPISIVDTNNLRIVRFPTTDGSVLVACSKPDQKQIMFRGSQ